MHRASEYLYQAQLFEVESLRIGTLFNNSLFRRLVSNFPRHLCHF